MPRVNPNLACERRAALVFIGTLVRLSQYSARFVVSSLSFPDTTVHHKQACTMYVITGGAVAPPRVLKASLRSRTARAAMRTFGLQALAALLRTLSPDEQVAMSVGASSAVQVSYIPVLLRSCRLLENGFGWLCDKRCCW